MHSYQPLHGGLLKNFFIRLVTKSLNTEHWQEFLRQVKILSLKSISILLKPFLRNPKRSLFLYYLFNQWPWLLSIYIGTISSWKWSILWQWVYFQLLEVHSRSSPNSQRHLGSVSTFFHKEIFWLQLQFRYISIFFYLATHSPPRYQQHSCQSIRVSRVESYTTV